MGDSRNCGLETAGPEFDPFSSDGRFGLIIETSLVTIAHGAILTGYKTSPIDMTQL